MNTGKTLRVHVDTEFTDFVNRDIISLGAAAEDGSTFYAENLEYIQAWASDWVKENVCPLLKPLEFGKSRKEMAAAFWEWLEALPCDFVILSFDYNGDLDLIFSLLGEELPDKVIGTQNIMTLLYHACDQQVKDIGGNDDTYHNIVKKLKAQYHLAFMDYFIRTKEIQHHALSDAKANREAWNSVVEKFGIPL